jgi:hypothetical protein
VSSPVVLVVDPRSGVAHCDPDCAELEGVPFTPDNFVLVGFDVVLRRCGECCKRAGGAKSTKPSRPRRVDRAQLTVFDELDGGDL